METDSNLKSLLNTVMRAALSFQPDEAAAERLLQTNLTETMAAASSLIVVLFILLLCCVSALGHLHSDKLLLKHLSQDSSYAAC